MAGTQSWRDLPENVYLVIRTPPPNTAKNYWDPKYNRVYKDLRGVASFIHANKTSSFKVYCGSVIWREIDE